MQDKQLYQQILGLTSPWTVSEVKLDPQAEEIQVRVDHPRGTKFCCPECQKELACYDHGDERRWRHLDSCQYKTILVTRVPRVKCPEHGVKSVDVPGAEPYSRFTILFESFTIDVLQMTQTIKGAMTILSLQWDCTWSILVRAFARGKARKEPSLLPRIGIDEKAFSKGKRYLTILFDLDNSTVEAIAEGRDVQAAKASFSSLNEQQIQSIEAIEMDMSPAYVRAAMDSKSGWGGQSFTLSLAGVWERGIRKMCNELSPATGWRSLPSKNRIRPWDDANGQDDPDRLMISDILLQRGTERWVLDAKYKCDFGNESRNDRFQMCAYALGFRASRATLVYPSQESSNFDQRELLSVDIGETHVRIESFALPMANGPKKCSESLRAKLQAFK